MVSNGPDLNHVCLLIGCNILNNSFLLLIILADFQLSTKTTVNSQLNDLRSVNILNNWASNMEHNTSNYTKRCNSSTTEDFPKRYRPSFIQVYRPSDHPLAGKFALGNSLTSRLFLIFFNSKRCPNNSLKRHSKDQDRSHRRSANAYGHSETSTTTRLGTMTTSLSTGTSFCHESCSSSFRRITSQKAVRSRSSRKMNGEASLESHRVLAGSTTDAMRQNLTFFSSADRRKNDRLSALVAPLHA